MYFLGIVSSAPYFLNILITKWWAAGQIELLLNETICFPALLILPKVDTVLARPILKSVRMPSPPHPTILSVEFVPYPPVMIQPSVSYSLYVWSNKHIP